MTEAIELKFAATGLFYRILPKRLAESKIVRVAVVLVAWVPLLVICLIAGTAAGKTVDIPFFSDPVPHVRFLISFSILLAVGRTINGRLSDIVSYLWNSGILVGDDRTRFKAAVRDVTRRCDSIVPDIVALIIVGAIALAVTSMGAPDGIATWRYNSSGPSTQLSAAGWWYTIVSLPLWQFVFIRWIWRMFVWWCFLRQLSRMELRLVPTHPDRAGGLGILQMGQMSFVPLVFSISTVMAASLAFAMSHSDLTLAGAAPPICVYVVLGLLFVIGPLFVFVPKLVRAKRRGLVQYGDLAEDLFVAFDQKWIQKSDAEQRKMLGSADPSSLSDFGYSYEVVTEMRVAPFDRHGLVAAAVAILVPFVPLLLVEHSAKEIVQRLSGLLF